MVKKIALRIALLVAALSLSAAVPARAQFTPRSLNDPATGEQYHVEGAIGFWSPSAQMSISSESLGIIGSNIDFKKDLGLSDQHFGEFHLQFRPSKRNKFRFQFVPINFQQSTTLTRDLVFQGIRYRVGLPVNSQLDWKAYRFGYEFDFVSRNRGFAGFILDAKYTDVFASLQSPVDYETLHAKAPIPALGGIGRFYVVPNISVTGELTLFRVPNSLAKVSEGKEYDGHYVDFDMYGTVNFTNNFGVQVGYRSFDVGYNIKKAAVTTDLGAFVLKGIYLAAVARF